MLSVCIYLNIIHTKWQQNALGEFENVEHVKEIPTHMHWNLLESYTGPLHGIKNLLSEGDENCFN